jgi:photosystem II protein
LFLATRYNISPDPTVDTFIIKNIMKVLQSLAAFTVAIAATEAFAPSANLSRQVTSLNAEAEIQFVRGLKEKVIPDIKLTRARDGSSGTATFKFVNPNVFDASTASQGEITGMFLVDDEGEMSTTDVNANFVNGKPQGIESTLVMRSPDEWDRFMRFMEAYGEANGLGFSKA